MKFTETALSGAYVIEIEPIPDNRGYFAVSWNRGEFTSHGLCGDFCQTNLSFNAKKGTLRGLHSQRAPYQEEKLIRCIRGAIYDVVVDIRPESPTYLQFFGAELTAENQRMMYVPKDFLHGFITLTDDTEVQYQVSQPYHPETEFSARHNDPAFKIAWPLPVSVISDKDTQWPAFEPVIVSGPNNPGKPFALT